MIVKTTTNCASPEHLSHRFEPRKSGTFDAAAYARDGFGVVRGAIAPILVTALKNAVQKVQDAVSTLPVDLRERLTFERDLSVERRDGIAATEVGDAIFIIGDPVAFDEVFWEVLRQPAVVSAVRQALGVHDVVAHFINVTIKHPRFGRAIGWHRDYPNAYASPATSRFVRAMLCLDGMSDNGGATAFIIGSHLLDDDETKDRLPPNGWEPTPAAVANICCDPGDMVIIHPKVIHGGGMNISSSPRRNIVTQLGDAAILLRNVPEREAVLGHRIGCI